MDAIILMVKAFYVMVMQVGGCADSRQGAAVMA